MITLLLMGLALSTAAMFLSGYRLLIEALVFSDCNTFGLIEMLTKFAAFICFTTYLIALMVTGVWALESDPLPTETVGNYPVVIEWSGPYGRFRDLTGRVCNEPPMICRPVPDGDVGFSGGGFIWFGREVPAAATVPRSPDGRYHVCSKGEELRCLIVPGLQ